MHFTFTHFYDEPPEVLQLIFAAGVRAATNPDQSQSEAGGYAFGELRPSCV